jgi:hypothetical protein
MIRIDEIYDHTFWPWIKKNLHSTAMYHCDPPGKSDADSILCTGLDVIENNFVFLFDQEPFVPGLHESTFLSIDFRNPTKNGILITSEFESDNIDYICNVHNLRPFYYFFHGWAALDWYRGYDKSFLITPPNQRQIKKTFFSANRIIGGLRQHRVLMLYHFKRLGLMDNWISASAVCPIENMPIEEIAKHYEKHYADIVSVIKSVDLPMLFPNEDQPRMSSCWLDQFDICAESLIYHVTETIYTGKRLHLTEKSFKPIALGMPFILTASKGSLEYLRRYGFKTFGTLWDESYDLETDDIKRAEMVAKVLGNIHKLSPEEKQQLFNQCIPIIEHNWNWFYNGEFEKVLWSELNEMLVNIKDHVNNTLTSSNRFF